MDEIQVERIVAFAMELARDGRTAELSEYLEHGLPVDVQDRDGNSLLMVAAFRGRHDTVRMLLDRGADVDLRNAHEQSPLAGAVFTGEDEVVRILVDAGAEVDTGYPTARAAAATIGREHLFGRH